MIDGQRQAFVALLNHNALNALVTFGQKPRCRKTWLELRVAHQGAKYRQRQRLVIRPTELRHQWYGTHHPIGIGDGIEVAPRSGGFGKQGDAGTVARPANETGRGAPHVLARHDRGGQLTTLATIAVTGEVMPEHHRPICNGIGKQLVVIQLGRQLLQLD